MFHWSVVLGLFLVVTATGCGGDAAAGGDGDSAVGQDVSEVAGDGRAVQDTGPDLSQDWKDFPDTSKDSLTDAGADLSDAAADLQPELSGDVPQDVAPEAETVDLDVAGELPPPDTGCQPECAGLECGDDGCGGSCGSCDDGDPCTEDQCDQGQCLHQSFSGEPVELFDMDLIKDPATLNLDILDSWVEGFPPVQIFEVRYTSYQYEGCVLSPVRIEAYVAMPASAVGSTASLPGIVKAHGLGGSADGNAAKTPAQEIGAVVLAYSGPGQGQSEGTGSTPDHLFDTVSDPRNSWFWEHPVAAMRGLTVLEQTQEVDPDRLGMTGYSGGSVATLNVIGVDDRVKVAVPVSACGYMDLAAYATPNPGWQADLLNAMTPPRTPESPEFQAYLKWLDPKLFGPTTTAKTLMINGAQDEFFPVNSFTFTFQDLAGGVASHRQLLIKDWDHGWFALFNSEDAEEMLVPTLSFWFKHHFGLSGTFDDVAGMPQVAVQPWTCFDSDTWLTWACAYAAVAFEGPPGYDVKKVKLHFSVDGSLTYLSQDLDEQNGLWSAEVPLLDGNLVANAVYFAEVEFQAGFLGPKFYLTSEAHIPPGFVPNILPIDGPIP